MDFKPAVETCLRDKYVDFSGRAARSEFWWFVLFLTVVSIILSIIDSILFSGVLQNVGPLSAIFSLITLIPAISVTARRLHDVDKSGWWQLLMLIPIIGFLVILYWTVQKGADGPNRFGPDPLGGSAPGSTDPDPTEIPPSGV
ncbi:MAG TPA: DUF805 domain-containing protein [Maritimibacter sp.]|nr:DUF805 domain-containing protein [Maritimibacter sp.]